MYVFGTFETFCRRVRNPGSFRDEVTHAERQIREREASLRVRVDLENDVLRIIQ
jgi:hypothetical protein